MVYDIDKVFKLKRGNDQIILGLAYCLDVTSKKKEKLNSYSHQSYSIVYNHLNFFLEKTNFEIWNEKYKEPYILFVKCCHYTNNFEILMSLMKKIHKQKIKFHTSPLQIMLTKNDVTEDFVKYFFKSDVDLFYEVKEEEYLALALKNCSFEVICILIENSTINISDIFYNVFDKTTRFNKEREEIEQKLKIKFQLNKNPL